jgi:hypothetical protein
MRRTIAVFIILAALFLAVPVSGQHRTHIDSVRQEIARLNQRAEALEAEAGEYEAEARLWQADAQNEGNPQYQKYADQEFAAARRLRRQAKELRQTIEELQTAIAENREPQRASWSKWVDRDYITVDGQRVYVGMTSDASVRILNPNGMKPYLRSDPTVTQLDVSLRVIQHFQFSKGATQVDITYERVVDPGPYHIIKIMRRQIND